MDMARWASVQQWIAMPSCRVCAEAIHSDGYKPLTQAEWTDVKTGFNTANDSWMFGTLVNSKEQINTAAWYTFLGWMCSESTWGMPNYKAYRCIGKALYDKISKKDWRRYSWVNPDDAGEQKDAEGKACVPAGYETQLSASQWANLPAYANLSSVPAVVPMMSWRRA